MEFTLDLKSRRTQYQPTVYKNYFFSLEKNNSIAKNHVSVRRKRIPKLEMIKITSMLKKQVATCFSMPHKGFKTIL